MNRFAALVIALAPLAACSSLVGIGEIAAVVPDAAVGPDAAISPDAAARDASPGCQRTEPVDFALRSIPLESTDAVGAVSSVDVNGDGQPDLLVNHGSTLASTWILLNTSRAGSPPSFSAETQLADELIRVAGDLNRDGKPDFSGRCGSGEGCVYLNTTPPGGTVASLSETPFSFLEGQERFADINGDGKLDFVSSDANEQQDQLIRIAANITIDGALEPSFATPVTIVVPGARGTYVETEVADINGDGKPDLVLFEIPVFEVSVRQQVSVMMNTTGAGAISFGPPSPPVTLPGMAKFSPAGVADVTGDGKPDVVVQRADGLAPFVFTNTTQALATEAAFAVAQASESSFDFVRFISDLSGDGLPDLVSQSASIWINTTMPAGGASFAPMASIIPARSLTHATAMPDLNGDGKREVVGYLPQTPGTLGLLLSGSHCGEP